MSKFGHDEHEHDDGHQYGHEHEGRDECGTQGAEPHEGGRRGPGYGSRERPLRGLSDPRDARDARDRRLQRDQHDGNEAVNSGPSPHGTPDSPDAQDTPFGPDSSATPDEIFPLGAAESGSDPDELALRRLLQDAVQDLEPSDAALDHLRRAVPARRARKRQAIVGAAAAALLIGTAVPALLHVAASPSADEAHPSAIGHSSEVPGGTGNAQQNGGGDQRGDQPSSKDGRGKGKEDDAGKGKGGDGSRHGDGTSAGASPRATEAVTATTCDAAQLGSATATAGPPDAEGKVYGAFRIANTSDAECTVGGAGSVVFAAQGAADPAKISVVDHSSGDAAGRLPDPATSPTALVLKPGTAYEVRFAWVPAESCPGTGASPDPTPSGDGASGGTDSGNQAQLGSTEGPSGDGTISVTHTAEPGAPSAATTLAGCAGTIYRTGVLAAS